MKFRGAALAAAIAATGASARAADFYAGKTISIVVGSDAGGGFDAFARLLARHLGRVIPGRPAITVVNMPGAGSATAASHVYSVAPKDGTVIGALIPGGLLAPLFEGRAGAYDTAKFRFLGSANASARLCISGKASWIKTYAMATKRTAIVGAASVGSAAYDYAYLHKRVHSGDFNIVAGYKGMADILLAMERGEVEMVCGLDWSSLKTQRPNLIRDGEFNLLLNAAVQANPELDALGIPSPASFAANDADRAVGELVISQQLFGRPYVVAPGTPPERLEVLSAAFDAATRDQALLKDAAAAGLDIDPASGAGVEAAVRAMYAAPARVIEGARAAIRP